MPSLQQIKIWDAFVLPCSRLLDRLTVNQLGKSILGVWSKPRI